MATERGFAVWVALGTIYRGWGKIKRGEVVEGMSLIRSGLATYRTTGTELVDALFHRPPGQGM